MKSLILSLLIGTLATVGAKEHTIDLTYPSDEKREKITVMLLEKFSALLESDADLKAQFEKLQASAQERAGGRYALGAPKTLIIPRAESVEFREKGKRTFHDTVIIYYPFVEGFRGGMSVTDGTFAVFQLKGIIDYKAVEGDDFQLAKAVVTAKFDGFQKTITAVQKETDE